MLKFPFDITSLLLASGNSPLGHVKDHWVYRTPSGYWLWSAHVGMIVLSGILTILIFLFVGRKIATGPESQGTDRYVTKGAFAHMIEVICVYLRDVVVKPILGDRTDRFISFLWTLFFFILINNILGLMPIMDLIELVNHFLEKPGEHGGGIPLFIGGTATANIWVTGALAIMSFFVINIAGMRELGVIGYLKHLTGGAPAYIAPIMVPVEIIGTFVKPFALMVRLFANMNGGHILLATLISMFVGMSFRLGVLPGTAISLPSLALAFAIYFLEIFVAFIQSFIFMFLTAIFIGQLSHHGDEHHEEEGHAVSAATH